MRKKKDCRMLKEQFLIVAVKYPSTFIDMQFPVLKLENSYTIPNTFEDNNKKKNPLCLQFLNLVMISFTGPTLKTKRFFVLKKYKETIDGMYCEP